MAALVLGTAGSIIGGAVGGPVGAAVGQLIGTLIGNLIDPPKVEGPRLEDLKLQRSTYGAVIPILYGPENRIAGNVIWQTDLVEHKQKSGGKGGPQVTTYTYSASWQVLLCAGPILGITKMWADGRLISTTGVSTDEYPFVLYYGDEEQLPDPTIEAEEGAGEVPAHRGYAHIVFTDVFLTDHGNRTASGAPALVSVSSFTPVFNEDTWIGVPTPPLMGAVLDAGQLVQYCWEDDTNEITYYEKRFNPQTGATLDTTVPIIYGPIATHTLIVGANSNLAVVRYGAPDSAAHWLQGPGEIATIGTPGTMVNVNAAYYAIIGRPVVFGDFIYASGGAGSGEHYIGKWGIVDGRPHPTPEVEYFDVEAVDPGFGGGGGFYSLTFDEDTGYLWAAKAGSLTTLGNLLKIDPVTMTLVHQWTDISGPLGVALSDAGNMSGFTVFRDMICAIDNLTLPGTAQLYQVEDDYTFTALDTMAMTYSSTTPPGLSLGGGYILTEDGIIRISALETLDNIYADISERCGLTSSQYNVTDLASDGVRGYRIATQMTGKNALAPLGQAYFVDGAEVDDRIVFVHRDQSPVAEIPDDELGVHESGGTLPPLLEVTRVPDAELPRKVDAVYINPAADYQPGAQYAARQTSHSELDVSLSWPITFTDDEARERVNAVLFSAWIEREPARFWTSRKWEALVPTDVVTVRGRDLRIVDKRSTVPGVIEFRGVPSRPVVFTQVTAGGVGGGFQSQTTSTITPETTAVLLDIPNLYQTDPPFGFRAAMTPSGPGSWTGATLYKSYDNTNYVAVASTDSPEAIGNTVVTGSPSTSGTASVGATLGVTLINDRVELESCTAAELAAGRNLFAVRRSDGFWNLMQYQYATLISANTYELSGLVQSSLDDTTVALHAEGDEFVLLPVITVDAPESDLNVAIYYKAVTFGKTLGATPYQIFTNTGIATTTYHNTVANNLREFSCSFGSPIGSPAIGQTGLVPAPTLEDCNAERILSVHGWIDNTGGSGSPSGSASDFIGDSGSGGVHGLVPAPAAGDAVLGKFLHSDGTWRTVASAPGSSGSNAEFGTGRDGSLAFDGVNPVVNYTLTGTTYLWDTGTITDATDIDIDAGVTVVPFGGALYCTGNLHNDGTISGRSTRHASASTGGSGQSASATLFTGGHAGGANGSTGAANASAGASTTWGGAGGAGGSAAGAGGTGGTPSAPNAQQGQYALSSMPWALQTLLNRLSQQWSGGCGGGGGRGNGVLTGGGGGAGGPIIAIYARTISGSGTIDATGGNGGTPVGAGNLGGGGGGGGGVIVVVSMTANWQALMSPTVAGGTGGSGAGTGNPGVDGSAGRIFEWIIPA
jgi:hypothetical protein